MTRNNRCPHCLWRTLQTCEFIGKSCLLQTAKCASWPLLRVGMDCEHSFTVNRKVMPMKDSKLWFCGMKDKETINHQICIGSLWDLFLLTWDSLLTLTTQTVLPSSMTIAVNFSFIPFYTPTSTHDCTMFLFLFMCCHSCAKLIT